MAIWSLWLDTLRALLTLLSSGAGLGLGFAIIVTTLIIKALLPISWQSAYRSCLRQKKLSTLQPQLQELKQKFADPPEQYVRHMRQLYQAHGLAVVDFKSLLASVAQMPVLIGSIRCCATWASTCAFYGSRI
jgi:YidC/Oxa1 family membrane protein insertase